MARWRLVHGRPPDRPFGRRTLSTGALRAWSIRALVDVATTQRRPAMSNRESPFETLANAATLAVSMQEARPSPTVRAAPAAEPLRASVALR